MLDMRCKVGCEKYLVDEVRCEDSCEKIKNYVFWIGVIPDDPRVSEKYKYGDFSWMEYSKRTWQYWCDVNGVTFVHYDKPSRDDLIKYKVNWQRWIDVWDYIPEDYDSVMLVDASIMVRWDAPDYFSGGVGCMCGMRADENWKWVYQSATGYADMFPEVDFNLNDYFCSGMVVFRKEHEQMLRDYGTFYLENIDRILEKEDVTVKRGRDQPVLNYFVQKYGFKFYHWSIDRAVNHLYRREILGGNWQLGDPTPFFIKYFKAWQFSGFPDRGETRLNLMRQTWELIKHNYVRQLELWEM